MSKLTDSYQVQDAEAKYLSVKGATSGVATLAAPSAFGPSYSLELPADDGTPGQVLATDGADTTYWRNFTGGTTTFADATFDIYKAGDVYAQSKFYCAAIPTATTRTITMPDANVDLAFVPSQSVETSAQVQFAKVGIAQAAGTEQLEVNGTAKVSAAGVIVGASTPSNAQWGYLAAQDQAITQASNAQFANATASAALKLKDSTTGTINIVAPTSISAPYALTLPPDMGTNTYVLRTDGAAGNLTWVAASGGAGGGSFSEAVFDLYKAADTTAKAVFSVGSGAGQTRVVTMPDADVNLANIPSQLTNTTSSPQFAKLGVAQAAGSEQVDVNGTAKATTGVIVGAASTTSTQWGYLAAANQSLTSASNVSFSKLGTGAGTVSAPTLTMTDAGTGIYRIGANNMGLAVSGVKALDIKAGALGVTTLQVANGTAAAPSVGFTSDLNTGLYRVGADDVGVACGGAKVAEFAATSTVNDVTFASNDTTTFSYPTTSDTVNHDFYTWYVSPSTVNTGNVISIVWSSEKHMFVATHFSTSISYSYDGVNWSDTSVGASSAWLGITYGASKFVAVSNTTTENVKYSSDGITFTTIAPNASGWYGICYGNSLFVAVGNASGAGVMTSSDAINWTTRTTPGTNNWRGVCYSPELALYCAVANNGTSNQVMTSTNGTTGWTSQASPTGSYSWTSIAWSSDLGMFAAVPNETTNILMISTNGTSWLTKSFTESYSWNKSQIIWNTDLKMFVLTGNEVTSRQSLIGYSSDGNTWRAEFITIDYPYAWGLAYSPELKKHVIGSAGTFSKMIFNNVNIFPLSRQISAAFCDWTDVVQSFYVAFTSGMCCSKDGTFIACDYTNSRMAYSTNGLNWQSVAAPVANNWASVCYSPKYDLLVATSLTGSSNQVITSSNGGTTWISRTTPQNNQWYTVCWAPELSMFCAVSFDGTNRVMTSTSSDASTWITQTISAHTWISICWSSKLKIFCAVSNDGYWATSPNTVTWTTGAFSAGTTWQSVCWAPELGTFCAACNSGYSALSVDGSTWSVAQICSTNLFSVTWVSDYRFFVFCGLNNLYISYDGTSLTTVYKNMIASSAYLYSCAYSKQNKRLAVLSSASGAYIGATLALPKTNNFMSLT